jgi:hypothetical protein
VTSLILNALWELISYNDFQLPKLAWQAIRTGSA